MSAEPTRVPVLDIDTLWVRGRATGRGALIGALTGAAVGGIALIAWCESVSDSDLQCGDAGYVLGFALGAVPGALLGTGIGWAASRWYRRYP